MDYQKINLSELTQIWF